MLESLSEFSVLVICGVMASIAPVVALITNFCVAVPMGKFLSQHWVWGAHFPPLLGWVMMESFALLSLPIFLGGSLSQQPVNRLLLLLFFFHYAYRSLLYPLLKRSKKPFPLLILLLGMVTCLSNAVIQGRMLGQYTQYPEDWLTRPHVLLGLLCWLSGFVLQVQSELVLRSLRANADDAGYYVPKGACFHRVTSSHYFGEVLEWFGFALATSNASGLAFFIYSFCYLAPRALTNHEWSKRTFGDAHPANSKAIIPFIL